MATGAAQSLQSADLPRVVEVHREDLRRVRVSTDPQREVRTGEVRLAVDHFALTSNNATYARLGAELGYWAAFPADPPWGRVPAWASLRVIESGVAALAVGDRFHGLAPMGTEVLLRVRWAGPAGFGRDQEGLSPAYCFYRRSIGARKDSDAERRETLLRPLFITSFALDREHAKRWPGDNVILTSASSRTAIGAAFLLSRRGVPVVGLTSSRHVRALRELGCYTLVVAYDDSGSETLLPGESLVVWDFAGSSSLRQQVSAGAGSRLREWVRIGDLHSHPGDRAHGELFFSPDVIAAQVGEQGHAGFDADYSKALAEVTRWSASWLSLRLVRDVTQVAAEWTAVLGGGSGPRQATVVALDEEPDS